MATDASPPHGQAEASPASMGSAAAAAAARLQPSPSQELERDLLALLEGRQLD